MAGAEDRLRREIAQERDQLTSAVEELREALRRARPPLAALAAAGLGAGFLLGGGLGATARLIFRRSRER